MAIQQHSTATVRALIGLVDLLPEYEAHLLGKGHRPMGRAKYRANLTLFFRWLGDGATVEHLTEDRITAYRNDRARTIAPATLFNELCCVRSWCRWCVKKRYLTDDPTRFVDFPKVPKPNPRALKRAQLKRLFEIIDTEPATFKASWRRNRLVLLVFLYTGVRLAELAGLRWGDIDLDANSIKIRPEIAKNGRTRAIPIHPRLKEELSRIGEQAADWPLITHQRGASITAMTAKSIGHIFERWLRTKFGVSITAHQLRHTLATELLRAGAPLTDIQAILGHDDLETTAVYLTIDSEHLRGSIGLLPAGW